MTYFELKCIGWFDDIKSLFQNLLLDYGTDYFNEGIRNVNQQLE